jgi:hypothetical protein
VDAIVGVEATPVFSFPGIFVLEVAETHEHTSAAVAAVVVVDPARVAADAETAILADATTVTLTATPMDYVLPLD